MVHRNCIAHGADMTLLFCGVAAAYCRYRGSFLNRDQVIPEFVNEFYRRLKGSAVHLFPTAAILLLNNHAC